MAKGFQISWTIEGEKQLSRRLKGLETDVQDFEEPLEIAAKKLTQVFSTDVFKTEGGVIREQWARLSPHTVAQKARLGYGGKGILERTGALMRGFRYLVSTDQAVIFNLEDYFKYHQSNKPRKRIPRRVMMKLADKQKQIVVKAFQEYITKVTKKV